uniref:Uncharacterized protein n=3 Tax=Vibrio TaxID=662 RepID=A0A0H4A0W3_9VIBR|nr:hypothetical protein [Vibrio sp. ZF_53]AKN36062.1 hypothetical protein [Vibrio sp. ZF_53]AKN37814.1 hypothetical protein [Vibrio sp. ZF_45]AKN39829.1 hypothetical protein [Vibrio tasmaniensis]
MTNKIISILGVLLWLTLMPFILFLLVRDLYSVLFLTSDELYVGYSFGLIPFLFVCVLFSFVGVLSLLTNREQQLKSFLVRRFNKNVPLILIALTIFIGLISKPFLVEHLLHNGYELEETVEASRPWYFDKDIYVKPRI